MSSKETSKQYQAADTARDAAEEALRVITARLMSNWEQLCLIADERSVDYQSAINKSTDARHKYLKALRASINLASGGDALTIHDAAYNAAYDAVVCNDHPHADEDDLAFRAAAKVYKELEK